MTLNPSLTPELELYLTQRAEQQGISVEAYILQLLTENILKKRNRLP
jgi:predicted HicB family RNase H-like nuclease